MLDMDKDKICFVVVKAREFDAQVPMADDEADTVAPDDEEFQDEPMFNTDNSNVQELKAWIDGLNWDEQCQMVALTWLGRGDFGKEDWDEAVKTAADRHTEYTAEYLLGIPLLAGYLEEGLAQFELSCEDFDMGHP
ncbi:MAG: DUF3775 domain-containing protein [Rhodospirillales bacterium]|jgi:hypothetical protein|nr:DUF3775 domain-containing protein [Rhodospirillales bacterium]